MKGDDRKVDLAAAAVIAAFHLGAGGAVYAFSWRRMIVGLLTSLIAGIGVSLGFHRLLTHRSYKTSRWLEFFLTICGMLSLQGGAIW